MYYLSLESRYYLCDNTRPVVWFVEGTNKKTIKGGIF